ncbi:MAG: IS110 family transposase [Flavobacterium sp.]|nr:IS110 family transposase [Flavobacterium sp.]
MKMKIVNAHAAGIDIGSRSHYVAIGQGIDDIKEFGVSHSEHLKLIAYLNQAGITTVAMESTGSYWQSLYYELIENSFEVKLIAGSAIKNFKKTDVKDAQSIQKLHTLGLLNGCFLPENNQAILKELSRHRKNIIEEISKATLRIQKCLRMMNYRLELAVSDVVGQSGLSIIRAIIEGNKTPMELAELANNRVKKSKEEIADLLYGNPRVELMFELQQNLEMFDFFQKQLQNLDEKIEEQFNHMHLNEEIDESVDLVKKQVKGKNQIKIPIQKIGYQLFGVDLMKIPCISVNTLYTFISEIGLDIEKFHNYKALCSHLRLAPNNKITGGKIKSSRTPKGKNPLALALRDAANVIGNQKKNPLLPFFNRIAVRKGRAAAITATARKLATIIYKMVTQKVEYDPKIPEHIQEKIIGRKIKNAKELLKNNGLYVVDNLGVMIS